MSKWPDPPADSQPDLTPEQRCDEFAAILAESVLRFSVRKQRSRPRKS